MKEQRARLLLGTEHACGYLPDRRARSAFIDPGFPMDPARYGVLLDRGFRRSGGYVYRPMCLMCSACRPARIVVADFVARRSQRRCLEQNRDIELRIAPRLNQQHFELYSRYLKSRHPDGGMDPTDSEAFHEFLSCPWGRTEFWEFRVESRLMAVAVVDRVPLGLSAVYTFFDPDERARSLGTYAILTQINAAHLEHIPHVYLGYWVDGSQTMDYKRNFKPMELLGPNGWALI